MQILTPSHQNISLAARAIKRGDLVAFPTETVYGLGADGLNPIAVTKIFEVKERPSFNPLILHIGSRHQLDVITYCCNPIVEKLIDNFWPGPLTLVLPKKDIVPEIVTAGNDKVAVRMPKNKIALDLINESATCIAAPSANKFGRLSPTKPEHVVDQLAGSFDIVLDGGRCEVGVESTILEIQEKRIILLRPGGLPLEEIEKLVGNVHIYSEIKGKPVSPGQLPFHYAPRIPVKFLDPVSYKNNSKKKIGALLFKELKEEYNFPMVEILSTRGDLREAAANLFSALHKLEKGDVEIILAEPLEETGLGKAIMDRLRKASKKFE